ncbi:two-component system, chemotaxis family, response regulator CheV [Paucidesulfovibrio gracilis DSM 16080]|uniref:Two-component system, chemotaxis family, response regulator CheV n=1 Tax=Paucidesulfovibrio gracilis DSM 16080 TaxID=1121449 RepID=A0A1T4WKS0_9BACT|nr:chemotaxis protein [Paucidesulfovibrio gracilis]SKA77904.1 two-component system, chemotaxis family, response regulator CheV [Paucidesulfovibrio gracilis DSM 16080]
MSQKEILLETGTNELEILEFFITEPAQGGKPPVTSHFGINVAKVMQVIESPNLEPPESAPHPSFLGNIPLRDLILPVLDLAVWLDINRSPDGMDIVIVTEFSQTVTGFLVSGVTEIHRVNWEEVIPPGTYLNSLGTGSIIGMVNMGDRFIQLLDLETILSEVNPIDHHRPMDTMTESRYTALVADDSATIRLMLKNSLTSAGFDPIITVNGKEALATLTSMEEQGTPMPDIIISDIEMPLMDGFSLTKEIKTHKIFQKLPVILYSSIITKELRHKGESVGADAQVSKPEMERIPEIASNLIEGSVS